MFFFVLEQLLKVLAVILPLLISVAYFTLAERQLMSAIQRRRGPNVVGLFGILQPLADGLKLLTKETVLPSSANTFIFLLAPVLSFMLALLGWAVIPIGPGIVLSDVNFGVLYLFAVSSLSVYGIICAGWASNSKQAFLGALRSAAQMVSYEVSIGFILVTVLLCAGSLNLTQVVLAQQDIWFCVPLLPMSIIFFISALAETNRHPFDLPEAEAELVSGQNVEQSAMGFALFSLGEYANIILISSLTVLLFFGGWLPIAEVVPFVYIPGVIWFASKTLVFIMLFIWARAAFPRYRQDQLIRLGWKNFLPFSIGQLIMTAGVLVGLNGLLIFLLLLFKMKYLSKPK